MSTWTHLVRRFVGSLSWAWPSPSEQEWVAETLTPGELALWRRMSAADQRHAVAVARSVAATLSDEEREARAAALLHDVGKVEAGFGPWRRAAATVAARIVGVDDARRWRDRAGVRGRAGRYLCHDEIGAGLLASAGSRPLVVAWAREHHLPRDRWSVPAEIGAALKAADDD